MNDFDKTFVFAFYNSFLKIELNSLSITSVLNDGVFK